MIILEIDHNNWLNTDFGNNSGLCERNSVPSREIIVLEISVPYLQLNSMEFHFCLFVCGGGKIYITQNLPF